MGPVDYVENPDLPVALSSDLSEHLQLHLPELQAPTLEDLLEDRLKADSTPTNEIGSVGPVDIADASDEARRFFED